MDFDNLRARQQWLDSAFGRHVLGAERALLDETLPELYGFHLMQLGISPQHRLYDSSIIRHKFTLGRVPGGSGISALTEAEQLPLESDSVDVVLLHHALEYSEHPHQLLREAARVVVPHGHLLIVGFNPWSAFGLRSLAGRRYGHAIWQSRLLGRRRLSDWLTLLDFAVNDVQYRVHTLPVNHEATLARLAPIDRWCGRMSLPFGVVYMVHARKQISPLTPVRQVRRVPRPRISAVTLASPRARGTTLH